MTSPHDPAEIREEMAQTRAAMSVTIDALQERLDPQRLKDEASAKVRETVNHLKEDATEKVREATIGKVEDATGEIMDNVKETAYEARYGIVDTIRQNPVPAALIGIGLAAMFFNGSNGKGQSYRPNNGYNGSNYQGTRSVPVYGSIQAEPVRASSSMGRPAQDSGQNVADQTKAKVQELGRQAQDKADDVTGQVKETVQQLGDQAQGTAENLVGQVKGTAQQVSSQAQGQAMELSNTIQGQVGQLSSEVQLKADWLTENFNRTLRESPLSLGVVAIALGAAAGMVIPSTPQENQMFGETRDEMLQKAESTAHDVLDQAAEQAKKAVSASTG